MSAALPPSASASSFTSFENITMEEVVPTADEPTGATPRPQAPAGAPQAAEGAPSAAAGGGDGAAGFLGLWGGTSGPAAAQAPTEPGSGGEDPLKELEVAAAKVADQARHAALAASSKIKEGAAEAKESLSALAANFTSWFANLEPGNQFALAGVSTQSKHQDYAALQEQLGLDSGEAILESFNCQLLQRYACANNPFTPDRQVAFGGVLHITSSRVCFVVGSERGVEPVKLDISAIKGVRKEAGAGGLPDRLVLSLSEGGGGGEAAQSLVLTKFSLKELEMDSALALLEHLTTQ